MSPFGVYFASASKDGTALLWSTAHITPLRMFPGQNGDMECVRFHPNGSLLATGSSDRLVRLWHVWSGCVRPLGCRSNDRAAVLTHCAGAASACACCRCTETQ